MTCVRFTARPLPHLPVYLIEIIIEEKELCLVYIDKTLKIIFNNCSELRFLLRPSDTYNIHRIFLTILVSI